MKNNLEKEIELQCEVCKRVFLRKTAISNHLKYGCPTLRVEEIKIAKRRIAIKTYRKNRTKVIEKMKEWNKLHAHTPERKAKRNEKTYKMIEKYPEKWKARYRLRNAIKMGKIFKPDHCEQCPEEKIQAHHHLGYKEEHWKDVQWLCMRHHKETHLKEFKSIYE